MPEFWWGFLVGMGTCLVAVLVWRECYWEDVTYDD